MTWHLIALGVGVGYAVIYLAVRAWRRRRQKDLTEAMDPRWLNEHAYTRNGDKRWK